MSILKGTIFITDKEEIVYRTPLNGSIKIINIDEDGILMDNPYIIGGTCLLPPIEAKIAEADGNEFMYDAIYHDHLSQPFQQQFISAMIAYLYRGGNLLLFLPEVGYNNTMDKLLMHFYTRYGIHIGKIGDPMNANCYYDERCILLWLNMIYAVRAISYREFLYMYPIDAEFIDNRIMEQLLMDMNPYCKTINDKINFIMEFHNKIHKYPNLRQPIRDIKEVI